MEAEDIQILRKDLATAGFDAGIFIGNQIADVEELEEDIESKMLIIFDGLAKELALHTEILENEVSILRETARSANETMLFEMDGHAKKLDDVKTAVDDVKSAFEQASEGAIKIGDRLSVSESERVRIEMAMDLINFINWYDTKPVEFFQDIHLCEDLHELRLHCVPEVLQDKDWGRISQFLGYLRRVLFDLSSDFAQRALKNILRVSEVAEQSIVAAFLVDLSQLMDNRHDEALIKTCNDSVKWLHTYNSGQTLHKRYIYAVIEKRMPDEGEGSKEGSDIGSEDLHDMSALGLQVRDSHSSSVDFLSQLFWTIGTLCTEQFDIIMKIFPAPMVPKMTRTLIQRIYNDPAFGIQRRVDNVLHPKPPEAPLPLADYLESLLTVREKLTALYIILSDLCSQPAFRGMGRENNAQSSRYIANDDFSYCVANNKVDNTAGDLGIRGSIDDGKLLSDDADVAVERSHSEVQDFLEEQIAHVLSAYMGDYFEKEAIHLRTLYTTGLRNALGANQVTLMTASADNMSTPRIRPDRVRSVLELLSSVANVSYLKNNLYSTVNTVSRMEVIARDDYSLPMKIKELYFLQSEFLLDAVLVPCLQASADILIKQCIRGVTNTVLPPMEYLKIVTFACESSVILKSNLDDVYAKPLRSQGNNGNMLAVCKESLKKNMILLDSLCKEGIRAWVMCVAYHMERLLTSMQGKNDFRNKSKATSGSMLTPTPACASVCQMLTAVAQAIHAVKGSFPGLSIQVADCFWVPCGRHISGILISHLRRMKISEDGAANLMRDMDEYLAVMRMFNSKDNIDMIICLKEIATVYTCGADKVKKVVVENLRHLDTDLVLSLTKARNDYGGLQMASDHWTRTIASTYSFSKWSHEPLWNKASNAQRQQQQQQRKNSSLLGLVSAGTSIPDVKTTTPATLRKTSTPLSSLYIEMSDRNENGGDRTSRYSDSGTAAVGSMRFSLAPEASTENNEHFYTSITGPSSFAAAMNSRFSNFAVPGSMTALMPLRPTEEKSRQQSSDDGDGSKFALGGFHPLSYLSKAFSGNGKDNSAGSGTSSAGSGAPSEVRNRPDLIGRNSTFGRESEVLIPMAQANLGLAPRKLTSETGSLSALSESTSATPMRDTLNKALSGWKSPFSSNSASPAPAPAPASAPVAASVQNQNEKKSMFSRFQWK